MKLTFKNLRFSRKKTLIITGVLVSMLLMTYCGLSVWMWTNYKDSYTNRHNNVKIKLNSAMGLPTTTAEQKAKWLAALGTVANDTSVSNLCTLNIVYRWQQSIVPALKNEVASCQTLQGKMDTLRGSLTLAIDTIRADEAIAAILSEPLKSTTVDETAYQAEIDAWSKAKDALNAVNAAKGAMSVKAAAISAAEAIRVAWNALMAANMAHNASQYQTALKGLTGAYGGLTNVSDESKKVLQTTANTVQKAYSDTL